MKLIIGCGYLGKHVARQWRGRDQRVAATTRQHCEELRELGLEPIVCDVLDPHRCRALPQADTVLYCVGFDRKSGAGMRDVYVRGLENVLAGLPRPGRFLHVSSTSVYGQTDGEEVAESSPTKPLEENGKIVLDAERTLLRHYPDAVILRFAGIYGPGRSIGIDSVRQGLPIEGDAERWLNLIHVADGAAAILAAEERATAGEIYNVSDGRPVRRREYFACAARVLGLPPPAFAPPAPRRGGHRRIDNRKLRALGWRPRYPSVEDGLRAIAAG